MTTTTSRSFELRTYRSAAGKLHALSARFQEHTLGIFAKHGIEVVGFWSAPDEDDPATGTLVYVCVHDNRSAAGVAWDAFRQDPEWHQVRAETERDGSLTSSVEFLFMEPTEFSPMH